MNVYKSKIDFWLLSLIGGLLILPLAPALFFGGAAWLALGICGGTALFMAWLYLATQYKVTADDLTIHGGLYKVKIPKKSILSVLPSRNVLASPAFSLDRLEITYDKNSKILISPKDKSGFLADIGWPKA